MTIVIERYNNDVNKPLAANGLMFVVGDEQTENMDVVGLGRNQSSLPAGYGDYRSTVNATVTIGQMYYVIMAHSGGDGCFVFIVHSRWIWVA